MAFFSAGPVSAQLPARIDKEIVHQALHSAVDGKAVTGATVVLVSSDDRVEAAAGDIEVGQRFFIASTTKLYITAAIQMLRHSGQLNLSDPIAKYLPAEVMSGLHSYKGVDYSAEITIEHCMAQTSGLPDYFEDKGEDGKSLLDHIVKGEDRQWSFDDVVRWTKAMPAHFPPGTEGKAHYSDSNYQLLGRIIEIITGRAINAALFNMIIGPLGLRDTYMYNDPSDQSPIDLRYKKDQLHIPLAMTSFGADGGMVSTAGELFQFLEAFFSGALFPTAYLEEMYDWNKVMFPLEYGVGIMRFQMPGGAKSPEFIGHSGLSGAYAYYIPERNAFLCGTVNQLDNPSRSYKLMMKLLGALPE